VPSDRESRIRPWLRSPGARPLVLGHRGARHASPENTLLAFQLALDEGADGVELDVRLDGDDRVIVLHDRDLSRVSGRTEVRNAERLRGQDFARIDVGRGERVPSLADVLAWARERNARVNVELKQDVRRPHTLLLGVMRVVRGSGVASEQLLFSSFHPAFVTALALLLPEYPRAWLVHARQRLLRRAPYFALLGADGVNPEHRLITERNLARWRTEPALISTWTVNDDADVRRVAALGVDAIISDRPGAALAAITSA
jgi:glycerophosphoryl diester phosphodiesterase